jgi:hypothetical protein
MAYAQLKIDLHAQFSPFELLDSNLRRVMAWSTSFRRLPFQVRSILALLSLKQMTSGRWLDEPNYIKARTSVWEGLTCSEISNHLEMNFFLRLRI